MKKRQVFLIFAVAMVAVALFLAVRPALADDVHSAASGDWSSTGTWSEGFEPTAIYNVYINPHAVSITQTGEAASVLYIQNGGSLSISSGDLSVGDLNIALTSFLMGHGTIYSPTAGTIENSGQVIAEGGDLDLSSFSGVSNSVENTYSQGWYVSSGSKLTLPEISVANGDHTYNWGESSGDTTIDMINSMRLAFNGVTTGGDVSISLLAADRAANSPGEGASPLSIFDISAPEGFAFTSVNLAFRYNETLAGESGINEADLKIYHYTDGAWHNVTSSVDTDNNIVYASGVTSFSEFGVGDGFDEGGGTVTPEPATIVSGLIGLLGLAGRRFIKRRKK